MTSVVGRDLRRRWLSSVMPKKPTTINLLVNDICNSRCVMCNIWQQKRDKEFTPDQLASILMDELYSRVEYVGVSGGEPTLRRDLPELFSVICRKLPSLKGTGIITNAIRDQDVIERVEASAKICATRHIDFNVMVSLDGLGDVHDQIRGKRGNFESAIRVIEDFKSRLHLPLSVGCTVTKTNLWHVGELLEYCKANDIYARFRIGEFVQRLYNFGQMAHIRGFNDDESYHLAMFFTQLDREYETRNAVRRTYRNIAGMLLGRPRQTACPYQDQAVVLDCRGNLQYCAPKSNTIGNALEDSSFKVFVRKLDERNRIRKKDCATCIHDYHGRLTRGEWLGEVTAKYCGRALSIRNALRLANRLPAREGEAPSDGPGSILITGWYGTETVGDKAILGSIVNDYRSRYPEARISVTSLYPFVTERTLRELGVDAQVIPVYSPRFFKACATHDELVMGGGPLMDLGELGVILAAFAIAAAAGKRRVVYGCGLGPLKDASCIEAVKRILGLADEVMLRDNASVVWAMELAGRDDIQQIADPAASYVTHRRETLPSVVKQPVLACFLRQWPAGYRGSRSVDEYEQMREQFEQRLGEQVHQACESLGLRPALYSMHTFFEGCDDRRFNRSFADRYLTELNPIVDIRPSSVDSIVQAMLGAQVCLSMRFHSVLFAYTLGKPFVAIDYTQGGKIKGFLTDHDASDRMVCLDDVINSDAALLTNHYAKQGVVPRVAPEGVAA